MSYKVHLNLSVSVQWNECLTPQIIQPDLFYVKK